MASRDWAFVLLTATTVVLPSTTVAQGRGWRWFQSCTAPTTVVLDVHLDTVSVFRTTFPMCLLPNAPWSRQTLKLRFSPTKTIDWPRAFLWRGGTRVNASSNAGRSFIAEIHEQGTDTIGSSLGIVIKSKDSLTVTDTIFNLAAHRASPADRVVTELVPGLVVSTYPLGWKPRSAVVRTRPLHNRPPPIPWIARNECPGEGCSLGVWAACSALVATTQKRLGAAPVFSLERGDRFTALNGDVHVDIPGIVVFRDTVTYLPAPWAPSQDTVPFRTTDTLYLLNELGEGFLVWWLNGQADTGQGFWGDNPYRDLDPDGPGPAVLIRRTKSRWWVRVRNTEGAEGWLAYSYPHMATGNSEDPLERCVR